MKYILRLKEENPTSIQSPEFKAWFGDWEKYPQYASKVVDDTGTPKPVYHGTARPDRVGNTFNPKRATSGPMAFFTDNPSVASGYANSKRDTSIDTDKEYIDRFVIKPKGSRSFVNASQYWYYLSSEDKKRISTIAPNITQEDNEHEKIFVDYENGGISSEENFFYVLRKANNNYIEALHQIWLTSGAIFDEEEKFLEVLSLLGLKGFTYDDPHASYPSVYKTYISMRTPLYAEDLPQEVIKALTLKGNSLRKKVQTYGADVWDKNTQDPREWLQKLATGKYAWTSIPDWVTEVLKSFGYDGIIDSGNKGGGGTEHTVYIPFRANQVKSAWNKGSFNPDKKTIHEGK